MSERTTDSTPGRAGMPSPPVDAPAALRFAVLGPVRAWRADTELDLGSRQVRLMVALLLVNAGQFVSVADFADLLWGLEPPARAVNVIHRHIGALRRLLEPDLPPRSVGRFLERRHGGYRFRVDGDALDLAHFRRLAGDARDLAERGEHVAAVTGFVAALGLWRGRCAAGLEVAAALPPTFAAVDRERTVVARQAADAALAGGQVHAVLGVLRQAAERDPFDERLQARLILALAADGKQAEAVATYHDLRRRLAEDLGMDPGTELRAAYDAVLHQGTEPAGETGGTRAAPRPAQLPATTRFFNGRQSELRALSALLPGDDQPGAGVVTVAVDGIPGIGKSTLAVHWAHLVAGSFPDGQLFVNLRGFDARGAVVEAEEALTGFLSAIGVSHRAIPAGARAQTALYRTMMSGRRMLIVVDNARDAEQVRPLIPGTPGSMVIVTSRNRLTGLAAQDGAHLLTLDVPSLDDARDDLRLRLGEWRVAADPVALDEIIASCGRLPLAMAVVGARAAAHPTDPLREIAHEIRANSTNLDAFTGDEPEWDLRTVCSWSYRLLTEGAARLFRQLSLHPGPDVGLGTIASLAGITPREAVRLVGELTRTRLLTEHRHHRYAFHDLIRVYAMELTAAQDPAADQQGSLGRITAHLRLTAHAANDRLMPPMRLTPPPTPADGITPEPIPDVAAAMAWFTAELRVLEALVAGTSLDCFRPWELAHTLLPYFQRTGMYHAWRAVAQAALTAATATGDALGQAHMLRMLAGAEHFLGDHETAVGQLERAQALFERAGQSMEQGYVLNNLGWVQYRQGRSSASYASYQRAFQLFEGRDDARAEALALMGMGYGLNGLDRHDEAIRLLRRAADIFERLGDDNSLASCADALADVQHALGRYDESIESRRQALRFSQRSDNRVNQAELYERLGFTMQSAGRPAEAEQAYQTALDLADRLGLVTDAAEIRDRLARLSSR